MIRKVSERNLREPPNLDLPISPFFFFSFSSTHPPPVWNCKSAHVFFLQARWEIRSEVLDVSAIWACCSFQFIYLIPGIYLSLCHCMNVWSLVYVHMNVRGFLLVKVIKMNSLFVCDLAQIALYWSVHSRDGWIQKIWFPRNVCVCVFLRGFLHSVLLRDCEFRMGWVETTRWNLLKTLLGFGLSQQAMIGEPRVPPGRWSLGDHWVIHPTLIDTETAMGCWARRWWRKQDKMYKHTHKCAHIH